MIYGANFPRYWRLLIAAAVVSLVLAAMVLFVATLPPRNIAMATGPEGGANYELGKQYRAILAHAGVTLELVTTSGSIENLERLVDKTVNVAFVQGGAGDRTKWRRLESLGTIAYEPFWLFYRTEIGVGEGLPSLKGRRISIGPEGSGTRALALELLRKSRFDTVVGDLDNDAPETAANRLLTGDIQAAFFVAAWDSPVIQRLLKAEGIELASIARADAYAAFFPYLNKLVFPTGVVDILDNRPPMDITLLAAKSSLVVRSDLHSALQFLLLKAAAQIHSQPGIFQKGGQFPAAEAVDFPLSEEAQRFYKSGRPFFQEYLPFWLATLAERILLILLPMAAVIYPIVRLVPGFYGWLMQLRILRVYDELRDIQQSFETDLSPDSAKLAARLNDLEERANRLVMPAAYSSALYTVRSHVSLVRDRYARVSGRRDQESKSP